MNAESPPPMRKPRFIFLHGVLGWGLPFFALMLAWDCYEQGGVPPTKNILSLAFFSAFGGVLLGIWLWKDREKKSG